MFEILDKTLGEIRNSPEIQEQYEIWDEEKQEWVSFKTSCYNQDSEFPDPKEAKYPINLITIFDSITKVYHTFGTKPYYGKENIIYHYHENEFDMIKEFIRFWRKDFPDVVITWYGDNFDMPYLINRINKLYEANGYKDGPKACFRLSPLDYVYKQENVHRRLRDYDELWTIRGITSLDYLYTYKVFSREKRESDALNHVCEEELGEGKLAFDKVSLAELSIVDWDKFVDYNIQDVRLLVKLEEKLKYYELCRKISCLGLSTLKSAESTTSVVTGIIAQKALENGKIIATFGNKTQSQFKGGFVREPQEGMRNALLYFDANSLYPNTMVTLNLSPETKVGTFTRDGDDIEITTRVGKKINLTVDKFEQLKKKANFSISSYNTLFSQNVKGLIPSVVEEFYAQRLAAKRQIKILEKQLETDKSLEQYEKYRINAEINDNKVFEYTWKILLNKIYGYLAEPNSPCYDIDLAASTTATGRDCIKVAANVVSKYAEETYGLKNTDLITYGDTDSVIITIQPILEKLGIPLIVDDKLNPEAFTITTEIKSVIDKEMNKWAIEKLNSKCPKYEFKLECIASSAIFLTKKHYILENLANEDGRQFTDDKGIILRRKYKYTGFEVVRTTTPKKVKPLIKRVVELIMKYGDLKSVSEGLNSVFKEYSSFDIEDIAISITLNNYHKYEEKANGYKMAKGTPHHVKAAIRYNKLIAEMGLDGKYETLKSGDKIKLVTLAKNKQDFDKIAFSQLSGFPKEFTMFTVDKDTMFEATVLAPLNRIFEAMKWDMPSPTGDEKNNLLLLFT